MKMNNKKTLKTHHKALILGVLIGLISGGVYAATTIAGSSVTYSNTSSGLSAVNVQSAIDELYATADIRTSNKFVAAYTYNSSSCVTGEESTCKKTTCYKSTTSGSCPAGTIIKYKVNDTTIINFHVMFDKGSTMTMQSQRNIVYNTNWSDSSNTTGPTTVLPTLESATAGWTNVNTQTYTAGTTALYNSSYFTGCYPYYACSTNSYTLASRTARARLIMVQEASSIGCGDSSKSCPKWMYNYLNSSTTYEGTVNDTNTTNSRYGNGSYWTMSANSSSSYNSWTITSSGGITSTGVSVPASGARAVVVVSK